MVGGGPLLGALRKKVGHGDVPAVAGPYSWAADDSAAHGALRAFGDEGMRRHHIWDGSDVVGVPGVVDGRGKEELQASRGN